MTAERGDRNPGRIHPITSLNPMTKTPEQKCGCGHSPRYHSKSNGGKCRVAFCGCPGFRPIRPSGSGATYVDSRTEEERANETETTLTTYPPASGAEKSRCISPICSHNTNGRNPNKPCSISWNPTPSSPDHAAQGATEENAMFALEKA